MRVEESKVGKEKKKKVYSPCAIDSYNKTSIDFKEVRGRIQFLDGQLLYQPFLCISSPFLISE